MKNIRIRTQPNDGNKHLKVKLEQSFDFLEILSLKLSQSELYRKFSSDYGVVVGRVVANRGFGVPNAKVSIFIPLRDDETSEEVIGRYPYKTPQDINADGVRYNLLEDTSQKRCHTPVGTFPNKRKVLDNSLWGEIYDNYFKFTTTTNQAGDFMIFGVPIGNQKVHMDVDISNIGFVSVKPYDLINQGYNENLFRSKTTFKGGTDLDTLVQIQSRDINVNVIPLWGDPTEGEIGVNRVDFNLGVDITPSGVFFGSLFTDQKNRGVRKKCTPRALTGLNCELSAGEGNVEMIRRISNDSNQVEFISNNDMKIDTDGNWAFTVPMNLDPVVTDEFGNLIPSEDPNVGIPTKTKVRFRLSNSEYQFGFKKRTANYLVPNMYNRFNFDSNTDDDDFFEMRWKKAYTVTNYIPRYQKRASGGDESLKFTGIKKIGDCEQTQSFPFNRVDQDFNPIYSILCIIISVLGVFLEFLNLLLIGIIFDVVLKFVCFLKHPFNSAKRSACRCQTCYNLNSSLTNSSSPPADWTGTIPDQGQIGVDDRLECAVCYDGGDTNSQTYGISTNFNILFNSITTGLGGTGTDGTYNFVDPTTSGDGGDVDFDITVFSNNVISILVNDSGTGYRVGDTITIPAGSLGGGSSVLIITLQNEDVTTDVTIDSTTINCSGFTYNICKGLCQTCDASVFTLTCNDITYDDPSEWAECITENLAESLGVVTYEFYNDWIIGSLYSFLFDYKVRFKRKGKNIEKFCDFNCRPSSDPRNPDDEHRRNVCKRARIVEKDFFNDDDFEKLEIKPTDGRGLIVENDDLLYYASRHDIDVNTVNPSGLTVENKENLLFATNIIELGSITTCDVNGEPYLIDRLESTSYQKDDGISTLFTIQNCGLTPTLNPLQSVNQRGIQLMSQVGVEISLAETERVSASPVIVEDADDESYTLVGTESNLPDYDGQDAILILDRDDIILRRTLCENFDYYGVNGVYSSTDYPLSTPLIGLVTTNSTVSPTTVTGDGTTTFTTDFSVGDYIEVEGQVQRVTNIINNNELETLGVFVPEVTNGSYGIAGDLLYDESNDVLTSRIDVCQGFDDIRNDVDEFSSDNMPPYYMYFGKSVGASALDKLRNKYFDNCVDNGQ